MKVEVPSLSTTRLITMQRVQIEREFFSKLKGNLELFRDDHFDVLKHAQHAVAEPVSDASACIRPRHAEASLFSTPSLRAR